MKKIIAINIFTFLCLLLFSLVYPLFITAIAQLAPNHGKGEVLLHNGKIAGFKREGQPFTSGKYFWGRPSAVNYNGAGSGGSNKGPSNPAYLQEVSARIDTFLMRHPYLERSAVPAELVTASGSGLDPHISPAAALVQVQRVAKARKLPESTVRSLVNQHLQSPLAGAFGPSTINVLELNLALEQLQQTNK